MEAYKVNYKVHNGWQYNDPKMTTTVTEVIIAKNRDDAYDMALEKVVYKPESISHDGVTISKKDIVPIKGNLSVITVLMADFTKVDINIKTLGESTLITMKNGKDFTVETLWQNDGQVYAWGFTEDNPTLIRIPIEEISKESLKEIVYSLEAVIGKDAPLYSRQAVLLEDLINYKNGRKALHNDELGLTGKSSDVAATLVHTSCCEAVLLHHAEDSDFSRAVLIPKGAFEDRRRVIEAIKTMAEE